MILINHAAMEEDIKNCNYQGEEHAILECYSKILENIELQIQVSYDYEQLKLLYKHKGLIKTLIRKQQEATTSYG